MYRDIRALFGPAIPLSGNPVFCRKLLQAHYFALPDIDPCLTPSTSCSLSRFCGLLLVGCEQLGIEDPAKIAEAREAEGRAVGGACRHSGRALEDCYKLNSKAQKAAIFAGWRDMDAYMRENNIAAVPSGGAGAANRKPATSETAPADKPAPVEAAPAPKAGAAHSATELHKTLPASTAGRKSA